MHPVIPVLLLLLASATSSGIILAKTATAPPPVLMPAHIVVMMMENEGINQTYKCGPNCAYITSLANQYGLAENLSSVAHKSLPDYLTFLNGSNFAYSGSAFATDCSPSNCRVNGTNILDETAASGGTWRAYMEDYVGGCQFTNVAGHRSAEYDDMDKPFLSMAEAPLSPVYCGKPENTKHTSIA